MKAYKCAPGLRAQVHNCIYNHDEWKLTFFFPFIYVPLIIFPLLFCDYSL